ncbi:hypothetical protein P3T76_011379 [Phytophthora citrophthora]|uniref:Uncharacterized protein n=1 Tax=Phytophthora citrophthora TaxID=4793 RepID=A0AAD9LF94_9STRA|nr:hypothetical protein P3T76_011379 [Phytophthora citrophthora]
MNVVVEDGVLTNDLVIDCGDASSLIVSTNKAYLELKDLVLAASDSGSVQIDAKSLFIGDVTMVSMLAPTLKTSELRVCFAASSQKAANGAANGDAVGLFLT